MCERHVYREQILKEYEVSKSVQPRVGGEGEHSAEDNAEHVGFLGSWDSYNSQSYSCSKDGMLELHVEYPSAVNRFYPQRDVRLAFDDEGVLRKNGNVEESMR